MKREEKMASGPGYSRAMGPASRTGGMVTQAGRRHDGKKEMDASCASQRGPSSLSCPLMGLAIGPQLPAVSAKGAGLGMRARRGFPWHLQPFLPKNVLY